MSARAPRSTLTSRSSGSSITRRYASTGGRVAEAEHPLVSPHRPDAPPDLVRQRLERQVLVGGGQRAGDGVAGPLVGLLGEEDVDCFLEPPAEQVVIAVEGHGPFGSLVK